VQLLIAYDGSPSAATAVRAASSLFPTRTRPWRRCRPNAVARRQAAEMAEQAIELARTHGPPAAGRA
jgi:hypothetical protein